MRWVEGETLDMGVLLMSNSWQEESGTGSQCGRDCSSFEVDELRLRKVNLGDLLYLVNPSGWAKWNAEIFLPMSYVETVKILR